MSQLSTLIDRVARHLQDTTHAVWSRDRIKRALLESAATLARQGTFGEIRQMRAIADQGQYTTTDGLPARLVKVEEVLYDGTPLYPVDEARLTYQDQKWEEQQRTPRYFTQDLQGLTQLRIVPAPVITGDAGLVIPPVPFPQPIALNFLLFTREDPTAENLDEGVEMPIPDPLEQLLVYDAVGTLAGDEGDHSDPIKASAYKELAKLFAGLLTAPTGQAKPEEA